MSLVIIRSQGYLGEFLSEDFMTITPKTHHRALLRVFVEEAIFKVLVFGLSLLDTLLHPFSSLLLLSVIHHEAVHFCSQTNEVSNGAPSRLVFKLPNNLLIGFRVKEMIRGVVRGIIQVSFRLHVSVDIRCDDVVH